MIPFCSIIILNYNGEKFIEATIKSVLALDYSHDKYEIIIVDNASRDKSTEVINSLIRESVNSLTTFIPLNKNLGFAGGNNVGIKQAKGKYIALLNNDCIVDKNWLNELVAVAEKDERIFAVNSKIYLGNTNQIQNAGIHIFSDGYARDIGAVPKNGGQYYQEDHGQYNREKEIDAACGAAVLYRKSTLDKIGLLDESFFLYYEDVEISERAKKHRYKIVYAPKAIVHHLHAASSKEHSPFFIYHVEKGRLLHMICHFPLTVFFKEYLKFLFKSILRIGYGIKHPNRFKQQIQYIKVSLFFLFNLPILLSKRITRRALRRLGKVGLIR